MSSEVEGSDRLIVLGHVCGVFGVRGWLKVFSETDPPENIFHYSPWLLRGSGASHPPTEVPLISGQRHGKGLIAQLHGCCDRDRAASLVGSQILVRRSQLPRPGPDEFYWADLEGLDVQSSTGSRLGQVSRLLATGANDVLVVEGERERLIPFVWDQVILDIDFERGLIRVDWDPDF